MLVDRARDSEAGDFDAAASVATYDYLLPVRAGCFLLPGSVERLVAELGEGRPGSLDLIRSPLGEPAALLSREAVVAAGGFGMRPLRGIPRCRRRMLWEPLLAAPRSGGVACRGFRRRGRCGVVDLRRRARDPRAGMGRQGVRRAARGRNGLFGPGRPHGMETPFRTLLRH